jgi:vesicle-fusing ATPase
MSMPRKSSSSIKLAVDNMSANRLALTNRVYVSPMTLQALGSCSLVKLQDSSKRKTYPYSIEADPKVPDDKIALNGLHRRFMQLSLGAILSVKPFSPPPNFALAALEIAVDLLAKKSSGGAKSKPKELNTERLAADIITYYEGQPMEVGRTLAMDFEGTKLELTVRAIGHANLEDDTRSDDEGKYAHVGQLLAPTDVTFGRADGAVGIVLTGSRVIGGGQANSIFTKDFDFEKLGIGGLDSEFNQIFRRAFASRIWPAHIIKQMGINHVRGMLLFGPPGCGKTLIARQIGKALNAREPKIVNGPEILNKFVGGSEEKIRELFADAEKEQAEVGDASMLHIVILDEMDAICKSRGTVRDGTGVSDSVVNQLLSKIDGVDSLNNILLIGMTNRKDMIDDALLRPGRLEVHVEIGLPDTHGRTQILNIHTRNMKEHNRLTPEVIDRLPEIAEKCKNFSGAELEGLVKAASSYALTRCVDVKDLSKAPDASKLILEHSDFERALNDIEPKFGAKSQELKAFFRNGIVAYDDHFDSIMSTMNRIVEQVRTSVKTPLMSVLLKGRPHTGKTAIAAKIAVESDFPFVRMIAADEMIGFSETSKCQTIHKVFMDSYKSPLSIIFIDDIERIIDYVPIGPRFSNTVLQTLLVLLKKIPPDEGRRLLVIGTTSCPELLADLGLTQAFGVTQDIPALDLPSQIAEVLNTVARIVEPDALEIAKSINEPIGIKQLLMVLEMARQGEDDRIYPEDFMECLATVGL